MRREHGNWAAKLKQAQSETSSTSTEPAARLAGPANTCPRLARPASGERRAANN